MSYNAIANFPSFSGLKINHQQEIKFITSRFQPYSDFNFVSLFSWNTDSRTEISLLNKNLVIKMPDYVTENYVYSIIGKNKIDSSLTQLLEVSGELAMVPEIVIEEIKNKNTFNIMEQGDHHDYIYKLETMYRLEGHRFKWKRKRLNRILRDYGERLQIINSSSLDKSKIAVLLKVFEKWAKERKRDNKEVLQEKKAISAVLENTKNFNLIITEMLLDEKTIGFSINEVLHNGFANCHFQKVILCHKNMDIILTNKVADYLISQGCEFVNWEQDLGVVGLRELKSSYCPEFLLKKYKISLKT